MDFTTAVKIVGIAVICFGTILCLILIRVMQHRSLHRRASDGLLQGSPIPQQASYSHLYKWLAPFALLAVPFSVVAIGNYHVFEGSQEVGSCLRCHVMTPIANDMMDPESTTLAARHFKNKWIASKQCFTCHKDYGFNGAIKAKMDGFRHLVKYTLGTYREPIRFVGRFNNDNCLQCHRNTAVFLGVKSHQTLKDRLEANRTNCTHCHGFPHPTPLERTPGTARYEELLKRPDEKGKKE
jgi:hypothetical protein